MNHESEVSFGAVRPPVETVESGPTPSNDTVAKPPPLRRTRLVIVSVFGGLCLLLAAANAVHLWLPSTPRSHAVEALVNSQNGEQMAEGIKFLFGAALMGILAAGCGYTLRKLGKDKLGRQMAGAGLGLSISCVAGAFAPQSAGAMTRHEQQFSKSVATFTKQAIDNQSQAHPAMPEGIIGKGQTLSDEELALKAFLESIAREAVNYQRRLVALKPETWLLPKNLANPQARLETRLNVAKARQASQEFHDHMRTMMSKVVEDIVKTATTRGEEAEARRVMSGQMDSLRSTLDACHRYDDAMFDEVSAILALMDSQGSNVRLHLGQLQFADTDALERYRQSLNRYVAMASKQDSLHRAGEERAKAASEAFRKAGESGDAKALNDLQGDRAPRSIKFKITSGALTVNGKPLASSPQAPDLVAAIGSNERRVTDGVDLRAWDSLGVYAYVIPKTQTIELIALSMNDFGISDSPKSADFGGEFELLGTTITDVDTPQSVNKRLPAGMAFKPLAEYEGHWVLTLDQCQVKLIMGPNGMLDAIVITPKADVSENQLRGPRF
ncbi:MAG: hypothetical protein GC200_06695 [Tepidisphaera sp.]|nr:hypothetical protein [Tepidisphaera sp.]